MIRTLIGSLTTMVATCLLIITDNKLYGQSGWDSTYRPDVYQPQVLFFSAMPATKKDVVFIGDSIIFWGDWQELSGNKRMKNRGIPGDTSFGLLERLAGALSGKPSALFIMIGINDLARSVPAEVLIANYKRMLDTIRLHSPATKVYFQSILPVNQAAGKLTNHYKRASEIPVINNALKDWAQSANVQYIDLVETFSDENGSLKKSLTWDGVHLTIEGYQAWLKILQNKKLLK